MMSVYQNTNKAEVHTIMVRGHHNRTDNFLNKLCKHVKGMQLAAKA